MNLIEMRSKVHRALGVMEESESRCRDLTKKRRSAQKSLDIDTKALEILKLAVEARRNELRDRVESLVTRGLRAVFKRPDMKFEFEIVYQKRGGFAAKPILKSQYDGHEFSTSIVDGYGGGVADVVSFLLRVIVLVTSSPRLTQFMALDESFKHVSPEYLPGVATLLRELHKSCGIQFLLVTHKHELLDTADVIYTASLDPKGVTQFELTHQLRDHEAHSRPA